MAKKIVDQTCWEYQLLDEMYKTTYFCKLDQNINNKNFDYAVILRPLLSSDANLPWFEKLEIDQKAIDELISICNKLRSPDYFKISFDLLKSLNAYLTSSKFFGHSSKPSIADVIVLSSLSRAKIWTKVVKSAKDPQSPLAPLFSWYHQMQAQYKTVKEYQFDPTILTHKLKKETIVKKLKNKSHPQFTKAIREKKIEEVEKFLLEGVDPDTIDPDDDNKPAICIAAEVGSLPLVKLLLKHGADLEGEDKEQMTAAFYAITSENIELIDFLFEQGADFEHHDCQDRTPLYWACCECNLKTIDYLYKKGLKYNVYSKLNRSPLSKTAYTGRHEVVKYLLSLPGIEVEHQDNRGRTALHNAVWGPAGGRDGKRVGNETPGDCPEAAELLLQHGADVNLRDNDGNSPLAVAAASMAIASIRILMKYGAKIDDANKRKETPLSQACRHGHLEVVKLLIKEYNPNRWILNDAGYDCVQAALVGGHADIVEFFLSEDPQIIEGFTNQAYYLDLLALISKVQEPQHQRTMLEIIFKYLKLYKIQIQYEKSAITVIIQLNDKNLLLQFFELVATTNVNEAMLLDLLAILVEYNWMQGLEALISEYKVLLENLKFKWYELGAEHIIQISTEMFTCLITDFQNDFLTVSPKGETLLHGLVKNRKVPLLVAMINLASDQISGNLKSKNPHLSVLTEKVWDLFIAQKDSEGLSISEIALIRRYMDIHTILMQRFGEELQNTITLPKYKLTMVEKVTGYTHSQQEKLDKIASLFYTKDDPDNLEDEKEKDESNLNNDNNGNNEEIKMDPAVPKDKPTVSIGQVSEEILNFYKLDKTSPDLIALKAIWNQATASGGKKVDIAGLISARKVHFINKLDALENLAERLKAATILGIDVEYHSEEKDPKLGMVCTLQISLVEADYVIDCIYLREHIGRCLGAVFNSWDVIKLFHGCDSDLKWLKNDFDIDCVRIFDTARADMLLNGSGQAASLGTLAQRHLDVTLDKSYQVSDWRVRPLPPSMLDYARKDSCVLLYLWWQMVPLIDKKATKDPTFVVHLAASLAKLCYKKFEKINIKKARLTIEA